MLKNVGDAYSPLPPPRTASPFVICTLHPTPQILLWDSRPVVRLPPSLKKTMLHYECLSAEATPTFLRSHFKRTDVAHPCLGLEIGGRQTSSAVSSTPRVRRIVDCVPVMIQDDEATIETLASFSNRPSPIKENVTSSLCVNAQPLSLEKLFVLRLLRNIQGAAR